MDIWGNQKINVPFLKINQFQKCEKKKITNFRKICCITNHSKFSGLKQQALIIFHKQSGPLRTTWSRLGFTWWFFGSSLVLNGSWSAGLVCLSSTCLLFFSWDHVPVGAHLYHGDSRSARNRGILQASYFIMSAEILLVWKLNGQARAQGWVRNSTYPKSYSKGAWQMESIQEETKNLGHYWYLASHL